MRVPGRLRRLAAPEDPAALITAWAGGTLRSLLVAVALSITAANGHAQTTVAGITLQDRVQLDGNELALAACGVRETLWIDHYLAALYLPVDAKPAASMTDPDQPLMIVLHVLSTAFMPDRIPEQWREPLREELRSDPLSSIRRTYEELAAQDRIQVAYSPGSGVTLSVNGRAITTEPGHALIASMLATWAESDPISGKLERLLLKNPC